MKEVDLDQSIIELREAIATDDITKITEIANLKDANGATILHHLTMSFNEVEQIANVELAKSIIKSAPRVMDAVDNTGMSVIAKAVELGNNNMLLLLSESGVSRQY